MTTAPQLATVTTMNLNGIRAAAKRGLSDFLEREKPAVLLLQEVRAPEDELQKALGDQWQIAAEPSEIPGRAGVAIAAHKDRAELVKGMYHGLEGVRVRHGLPAEQEPSDTGRWLESGVRLANGHRFIAVSAYFHSGEVGTPKQDAKMASLKVVRARMKELLGTAMSPAGVHRQIIMGGDLNIVRSERDIKNWKPNHNKRAGVLDEEIAYLNGFVDDGWHDVTRDLAGDDVQGPYTWWSWRGKAFDNDAGWRIDYQFATPAIASEARAFRIDRAAAYDQRISDHAALSIDYEI